MKTKFKIWLLCALLLALMCIGCEPEEEDPAPKIPDRQVELFGDFAHLREALRRARNDPAFLRGTIEWSVHLNLASNHLIDPWDVLDSNQ